jgi:PPP family 3-phenylpropionic acid transporter
VGGGARLAGRSPSLILWLTLLGLALTVAACLVIPAPPRTPSTGPQGLLTAITSRRVALVLLAAALIQASHGLLNGFAALHWQRAGYGQDTIGWLWASSVVMEVVLFVTGSSVIRRIGAGRLLWIAAAAGIVRWSLAAGSTALVALLIVQALHALTFAATHLATIDFLGRETSPSLASAMQTLFAALVGTTMGLSTLLGGALYEALGGAAFLAMGGLCVAAMGLLVLSGPSRPGPASR